MQTNYLDFEKPLVDIDKRIETLTKSEIRSAEEQAEIEQLAAEQRAQESAIYQTLSAWERIQLSRHTDRPYTLNYIEQLCTEFVELHGDRAFADDPAVVGGLARFQGQADVVVGHQRGRTVAEKVRRNFGMA